MKCLCGCDEEIKLTRHHKYNKIPIFITGHNSKQKNVPTDVWKYIDEKNEDECWEWKGGLSRSGYGRMSIGGKYYSAHRLVYELTYNEVLNDLFICHRCNNPKCCNPKHLYAGTQKDNLKQMVKDKRSCVGEKNGQAKLTMESVLEMRKLYSTGKYTQRELGKVFKISYQEISLIINRKRWKYI